MRSSTWRRRSRGFCQDACEVEARAGREPAGPAPSLGRVRLLRGCPAQPRPTSLAVPTMAVTRPGLGTFSWWVSVWGGPGPGPPCVRGADALERTVPFPGGGGYEEIARVLETHKGEGPSGGQAGLGWRPVALGPVSVAGETSRFWLVSVCGSVVDGCLRLCLGTMAFLGTQSWSSGLNLCPSPLGLEGPVPAGGGTGC